VLNAAEYFLLGSIVIGGGAEYCFDMRPPYLDPTN
jgi:hypothetical protein